MSILALTAPPAAIDLDIDGGKSLRWPRLS